MKQLRLEPLPIWDAGTISNRLTDYARLLLPDNPCIVLAVPQQQYCYNSWVAVGETDASGSGGTCVQFRGWSMVGQDLIQVRLAPGPTSHSQGAMTSSGAARLWTCPGGRLGGPEPLGLLTGIPVTCPPVGGLEAEISKLKFWSRIGSPVPPQPELDFVQVDSSS